MKVLTYNCPSVKATNKGEQNNKQLSSLSICRRFCLFFKSNISFPSLLCTTEPFLWPPIHTVICFVLTSAKLAFQHRRGVKFSTYMCAVSKSVPCRPAKMIMPNFAPHFFTEELTLSRPKYVQVLSDKDCENTGNKCD